MASAEEEEKESCCSIEGNALEGGHFDIGLKTCEVLLRRLNAGLKGFQQAGAAC